MRILLDTNTLIYREDARIIADQLQQVLVLLNRIGAELLIHPVSMKELKTDVDRERKKIILSKIAAYSVLASPPEPQNDSEFLAASGVGTISEPSPDDAILYAIYRAAADFLITEDRGIHKKARRVGINDRVLLISDALDAFDSYIEKEVVVPPPALRDCPVYNLDLRDPIFDSLRRDYEEFDDWFRKISREGRKSWVYFREDKTIGALLIYKIEDEATDSTPPLPKKRRLKLATFKVTNTGYRIGELFIKLAVDLCVRSGISEVYLTHFSDGPEDRLLDLISQFGFCETATNRRGEQIFLKKLVATPGDARSLSPLEIATRFYPSFYDGALVRKFVVPIQLKYHDRLFTDYPGRKVALTESREFIAEGNTIKKAYVCHAKTRTIHRGDIVLFYLSGSSKLTFLGVVEQVRTGRLDAGSVLQLVAKRTVYTLDEIEGMTKKPATVILFRQHFRLEPVSLKDMKQMGVLKGPPQSIQQITDRSYEQIKEKVGIDARFTVN